MESILKNRLLNNQLDRKTVIRVEASLSSGYSIFSNHDSRRYGVAERFGVGSNCYTEILRKISENILL